MEVMYEKVKSSLQSSETLIVESSSSSSASSHIAPPPSKVLRQGSLTVENVKQLPLSAGWKATTCAQQAIEVVSDTSVASSLAVDEETKRLLLVSVANQQLANLEVQRLEAVVRKAATRRSRASRSSASRSVCEESIAENVACDFGEPMLQNPVDLFSVFGDKMPTLASGSTDVVPSSQALEQYQRSLIGDKMPTPAPTPARGSTDVVPCSQAIPTIAGVY